MAVNAVATASGAADLLPELGQLTAGGLGVWTLVGVVVVALIKGWPALKKLQIDGDQSLRADLLKRIGDLEKQMADERHECNERLREMQKQIDGLLAAIRQNSQSSAMMISDPGAVATSVAAKRAREAEGD